MCMNHLLYVSPTSAEVMAEVQPSTSRGEDAVELVGEASCSGADGSTSPESAPSALAAESPSFFTWMWIQVLAACSRASGARRGGLSGSRLLGLASGAQQQTQVAASKSTWSEVPGSDIHCSVSVPRPSELSTWEELKASAPSFFNDWVEDVELGPLIAEGGQAQIFEVKDPEGIMRHWGFLEYGGFPGKWVLKVFKLDAGFSLADLKRHWPRSMRKDRGDSSEYSLVQERRSWFVFERVTSRFLGDRCKIVSATLLKDGRFAFLMPKYQGDLRTLIDLKVEDNSHSWKFGFLSQPPFSFVHSIWIMLQIASGMQGLHEIGVLHRDLKAANVLVGTTKLDFSSCYVADYECAMFVQGTGFWRAPEVLHELLKKEEDRNGEIWTEKVDVYSFGMTCYEILTGQIPFDGYTKNNWGDVIKGERPCLPDYVFPKLRELVESCWHSQPSQRPSFDVIIEVLFLLIAEV